MLLLTANCQSIEAEYAFSIGQHIVGKWHGLKFGGIVLGFSYGRVMVRVESAYHDPRLPAVYSYTAKQTHVLEFTPNDVYVSWSIR